MEHRADLKIYLQVTTGGRALGGAGRRANTGEREVNGGKGRIGVVLHWGEGGGGGTDLLTS